MRKEVELNARLAKDIYLDVLPIYETEVIIRLQKQKKTDPLSSLCG